MPDSETIEGPTTDPVIESHERHRRRAPLRWGCGLVLGFITIAAVAIAVPGGIYVTYGILDRQAYARELALLREADEPLTLEQIEAYYPTDPATERTTQLWLDAIDPIGAEYYAAIGSVVHVGTKPLDQAEKNDRGFLAGADLADATAFVQRYRETIETARAARRSGAVARYPIQFGKLFGQDFDHLHQLRNLTELLRLDSEVRLAEGDHEAVVENLMSAIAAGESLQNEPIFVSQLVRQGCLGNAILWLEELLARIELPDAELARLQQAFEDVETVSQFRQSLRVERFMALCTIRGESPIGDPEIEKNAKLRFRDGESAKVLEFYRLAEEATREGLIDVGPAQRTIDEELKRIEESQIQRMRFLLISEWSLTSFEGLAIAALRSQAQANVAATAIACERYRLAHGDWPASLDALSPEYVTQAPLDPFSETPLRYVVDPDAVRVYSIGADRTDDGGKKDPVNYDEGDVVMRLPTERPGKDQP